jgi:hypothetical protein
VRDLPYHQKKSLAANQTNEREFGFCESCLFGFIRGWARRR